MKGDMQGSNQCIRIFSHESHCDVTELLVIGQLSPAGLNYFACSLVILHPSRWGWNRWNLLRFNHHNCCWLHPHNMLWLAISLASKVVHGTGVGQIAACSQFTGLTASMKSIMEADASGSVSQWMTLDELWPECLGFPPRWRLRLSRTIHQQQRFNPWWSWCLSHPFLMVESTHADSITEVVW